MIKDEMYFLRISNIDFRPSEEFIPRAVCARCPLSSSMLASLANTLR